MRLIDADVLESRIKKVIKKQGGKDIDLIPVSDLLAFIGMEPTAYDVDAVVEQLEQQAEQYHSRAEKYASAGVPHEVEHMAGKAASYEHAIEIVKGVGVNV